MHFKCLNFILIIVKHFKMKNWKNWYPYGDKITFSSYPVSMQKSHITFIHQIVMIASEAKYIYSYFLSEKSSCMNLIYFFCKIQRIFEQKMKDVNIFRHYCMHIKLFQFKWIVTFSCINSYFHNINLLIFCLDCPFRKHFCTLKIKKSSMFLLSQNFLLFKFIIFI